MHRWTRVGVFAALVTLACKHEAPRPDASPVEPAAVATKTASADANVTKDAVPGTAEEVAYPLPPAPDLPPTPAFFPPVEAPADNPLTPEKAQLGKLLFFDPHLSKSGQMSCETCHYADKGWAVPKALSAKDDGTLNKRNAPSVLNLAYHREWYWDGRAATLEAVSLAAWKGQLGADPAAVTQVLNSSPAYRALFARAFGQPANPTNVPQALASFFRTLKSGDSPWDRFEQGEKNAVSKQVQRGFEVFRTANCALCHVPPFYSDFDFHNVGVGMDKPEAERDTGRMAHTKDPKNMGQFKTPSLRDVALTAPYFHDGSVATLDEAIELMAKGGRKNALLDPKLKPVKLSAADKAALKAFLESLTGKQTFTPVDWVPPIP